MAWQSTCLQQKILPIIHWQESQITPRVSSQASGSSSKGKQDLCSFRHEPGLTPSPGQPALALSPWVLKSSKERLHNPSVPVQPCSPGGDFLPDVQPEPPKPQLVVITPYAMPPGSTENEFWFHYLHNCFSSKQLFWLCFSLLFVRLEKPLQPLLVRTWPLTTLAVCHWTLPTFSTSLLTLAPPPTETQ